MTSYRDKYLKYKTKYINLKQQDGGNIDKFINFIRIYKKKFQKIYILKNEDVVYILIGEDHYKNNFKEDEANIFLRELEKNINSNKIRFFIEAEEDNSNDDNKIYLEFLKVNGYINKPTIYETSLLLKLRDLKIEDKIKFDIRYKVCGLYKNNISDIVNIFGNLQFLYDKNNDKQNEYLFNMIVGFLDKNIIIPFVSYLYKNKTLFTHNSKLKMEYEKIIKDFYKLTDKLIREQEDIIKKIKKDIYEPNILTIEKIILEYPQKVTDLFLLKQIIENDKKENIIYGGEGHIENIKNQLITIGFDEIKFI